MPHSSDIYTTDQYARDCPTLHQEDSAWKLTKILPLVDSCLPALGSELTLLDVGGGAGAILSGTADHIRRSDRDVRKIAMDLSPSALEMQQRNNDDLTLALHESIEKTSIENRRVDICLMIDVLEHLPDPGAALEELRRISRFVIFKVPLENNLSFRLANLVSGGRLNRKMRAVMGHVNRYTFRSLRRQVEADCGRIIKYEYADIFSYVLESPDYRPDMSAVKIIYNRLAKTIFRFSPSLSARLFNDFVVMLVETK